MAFRIQQSLLIVVPTLNSYDLLPRLLGSLQGQSWSNWRLVFIDGPSDPDHRQWLKKICAVEPRCCWIAQDPSEPGIFGAMNQGFVYGAKSFDWLLFWGSDDWVPVPTVLAKMMNALAAASSLGEDLPDLVVCRGRYVDACTGSLTRRTNFKSRRLLNASSYRRALWLGSTPPHQATLFGVGARQRLARYDTSFCLSADLDYFLQLSRDPGICVQCLDIELVHMADGGVSGQQTQRRLNEVRRAYRHAFGWYWWFPFLMRYLRRVASLFVWSR